MRFRLCFIFCLLIVGCAVDTDQMTLGVQNGVVKIAPDGGSVACRWMENGKYCVRIGGETYKDYTEVLGPYYSEMLNGFWFWGLKTGGWFLTMPTKVAGPFPNAIEPIFGSDKTAMFGYREGKQVSVFVDGNRFGRFDELIGPFLIENPKTVFFIARDFYLYILYWNKRFYYLNNKPEVYFSANRSDAAVVFQFAGKTHILTKNREIGGIDEVSEIVWSKDGAHFGAITTENGRQTVRLDDRLQSDFDSARDLKIAWDGSFAVYRFERDGKIFIRIGESEIGGIDYWGGETAMAARNTRTLFSAPMSNRIAMFDGARMLGIYDRVSDPVVSDDGSMFGYAYSVSNRWFVRIGEEISGDYDDAAKPIFSSDNCLRIFWAKHGDKWFCNQNGVVSEGFPRSYFPVFNRSRTHFTWWIKKSTNDWALRIDERTVAGFQQYGDVDYIPDDSAPYIVFEVSNRSWMEYRGLKSAVFERIKGIAFSSNGNSYAIVGERNGKSVLELNGKNLGRFDSVSIPVFHPDGADWWYSWKNEGQLYVKTGNRVYSNLAAFDMVYLPGDRIAFAVLSNGILKRCVTNRNVFQ